MFALNFKSKRASMSRRQLATILGFLLVVFAVIGVIATARGVFVTINGLFDDSAKRERYESFISPVVMVDPAPFTMVENLEDSRLLQSAMWAALTGENRGAYTYDDGGLLLVPASDLNVAATKLYGPNVKIIHRSFEDNDASYLYDPDISAYRVPSINKVAYSPYVTEIKKDENNNIVLTVGYVSPGNIWSTDTKGQSDEPVPEKFMLYTLTEWDQGYYISSVNYVDPNAAPRS